MKAAAGAVARGCIRRLKSDDLFRREKRRSGGGKPEVGDGKEGGGLYGRLDEEGMRGGADGGGEVAEEGE